MTEPSHTVFLSYASQDAPAAQRICEALRAAGIAVWFDQNELRGGDAWDQSIRRQIKSCALFIAVISKGTNDRDEGYFRLEWKLAVDRSHLMAGDRTFLLPVVVDDTQDDDERVPEHFREVQWTRLPGGETPAVFVERVRRLLAPTEPCAPALRHEVNGPSPAATPHAKAVTAVLRSKRGPLFAAAVVLLAAVALASGYFMRRRAPDDTAFPAKSIAVLPFENLSSDKDNAYFVAGMQELILTKLADVGDLKVIARTSTANYASHPEDLKTVGQQLGVATILEGSVQRAGNQVLISVQLIDAQTDAHIWAEAYTKTLDNVFGVEGEVAQQVATALDAKLSPAQGAAIAAVPTTNRAAYDAFLRAEYRINLAETNNDPVDWKASIPLYRQAVQADPGFALAWARLSFNESVLAWLGVGGEDVKELNQQARTDAEQAVKLAPDLAAAQLALGYCEYLGRGDNAAGLQAFGAVLKLKPNDADALSAQGFVQRRMGRLDDAIVSLDQALTLNPRDSALASYLGSTYAMASRYAEAEQAFQRAVAIDPNNLMAKADLANAILFSTGNISRAWIAAQGNAPALKFVRVFLLTLQRKYPEALALLDSIPDTLDNFSPGGGFLFRGGGSKAQAEADLLAWDMGDFARARPLFARDLDLSKAQLKVQQGFNLESVWVAIGDDELGLGHTAEGLDAVAKALTTVTGGNRDQFYGPPLMEYAAETYAKADRADLAVQLLEQSLASPGGGAYYSPTLLWLDPGWDSIRRDPRFQALEQKYARYKPAVTYPMPSASATTAASASASISALH